MSNTNNTDNKDTQTTKKYWPYCSISVLDRCQCYECCHPAGRGSSNDDGIGLMPLLTIVILIAIGMKIGLFWSLIILGLVVISV